MSHDSKTSSGRTMSWARGFRRLGSSSASSSPLLGKDKKKEDKDAPQLAGLEKLLHDTGIQGTPPQPHGNDKFFGLENFGNTCYANSILQSLYYSEPFREEVINYPQRAPLETILTGPDGQPRLNVKLPAAANANAASPNKQKNPASPATARNPGMPAKPEDKNSAEYKKKQVLLKGPVLRMDYDNSTNYGMRESLFSGLKDIFEGIIANTARVGVVSPTKFVELLRQTNETFRSAMHQDAHEFLNLLLNAVIDVVEEDVKQRCGPEQTLARANGRPVSPTGSADSAATQRALPNGKWVHDLFQGTLTSETRCLTCENTSQRDEPFIDLSVDIEQHSSVTACLRKFSEEEMLCEKNKFHCDNCGGLQEAEKRMKIKRLPRILALHLKRFKYTEDFSRLQKLFHRVVYPFYLRLFNTTDDAEEPDKVYELYAIVVHIGAGPYQGHYVSVVKTKEAGWLLFDDELVEPVKKEFVQNFFGDRPGQACAYLLFYQETTTEAIRREQARENVAARPNPAAVAAAAASFKASPLGLDVKNLTPNGFKNAPVLETPQEEDAPELSRASTSTPLSPGSVPIPVVTTADPHYEALRPTLTAPNGVNHAPPAQVSASAPSSGLLSRMRAGSKSGKKPQSGFWGSLDMTKEGKDKSKEKALAKRKSRDLMGDPEVNTPVTPSTAGPVTPSTPAPTEPETLPEVPGSVPAGIEEQAQQQAESNKKSKFGSLLRRRATELKRSSSRGNILGRKVET